MNRTFIIGIAVLLIALLVAGVGLIVLSRQNTGTSQPQIDQLQSQIDQLKSDLDKRDKQIADLQKQTETDQKAIDALRKQVIDLGGQPVSPFAEINNATMDEIGPQVEAIRGLTAKRPVTRTIETRDALRQLVVEMQQKEYSKDKARSDVLGLAAFGLVKPDLDLYTLYIDLLSEQIAGFYRPDDKALYVIGDAGPFGPLEKTTFAHEFTHALQDQHFDLVRLGFSNDQSKQTFSGDQQMAVQALVEGDATLLMQQWATQHLTAEDILAMVQQTPDSPVLDKAPGIIRESLLFPYTGGLNFVTALQSQGGWEAIDQAFTTLPASTEQILHRQRYPDDRPIPVSLPALTTTLGPGWRIVADDVLGEWSLRQYLQSRLSSGVLDATEGWGGDRYAVYVTDETFDSTSSGFKYVLVLSNAWDTTNDADEFAKTYRDFLTAQFGANRPTRTETSAEWWVGSTTAYFTENGDHTLIVVGPDEATIQKVVSAVSK
jgi:hypothetical protein